MARAKLKRIVADQVGRLEAEIDARLHQAEVELVCLAGFMRILSDAFVESWLGRMLNIHPSLLPAFPGLDTHARALAAGVKLHGCTVHLVTREMDAGPILAQAAVPVLPGDTAEALAARVLAQVKGEAAQRPESKARAQPLRLDSLRSLGPMVL